MKKVISLLIAMGIIASGGLTAVQAAGGYSFNENFDFENVQPLKQKEVKKMYGKLHKQAEFMRSINRMKNAGVRVDVKNFEGFTADRFENIQFNEVQEDVKVFVFSYTSNKLDREGQILIVYKDGHIIENGSGIYY